MMMIIITHNHCTSDTHNPRKNYSNDNDDLSPNVVQKSLQVSPTPLFQDVIFPSTPLPSLNLVKILPLCSAAQRFRLRGAHPFAFFPKDWFTLQKPYNPMCTLSFLVNFAGFLHKTKLQLQAPASPMGPVMLSPCPFRSSLSTWIRKISIC